MRAVRTSISVLLALSFAAPVLADDVTSLVIRLGQDTTSVERYTRTPSQVVVDQVGRAPRLLQRHFVYDYANGALTKVTMVVTPPGATTPTQTLEVVVGPDSTRTRSVSGTNPPSNSAIALPAGTLIVPLSSPWSGYESLLMKFVKEKGDSLRTTMFAIGAPNSYWLRLHKLGKDSIAIFNEHLDLFHVRVDKTGHILGVLPIAGTGKVSVERVAQLDLAALTASFVAREKSGAGMGTLSPRDSVVTSAAGGAALWIDYGRPGKRGRTVFGGVVPYGEVWRTGANAATQFRTDKALDFGGTVVPAGFYTLWTIPSPTGWKLIVNGETGQWGTEHKAAKDLYTIDMKTSALPQPVEKFTISVDGNPQGGVLNMDWDTTRASVAFTVKP
jgi:hypothetical protein